jgi:hypothetical protein
MRRTKYNYYILGYQLDCVQCTSSIRRVSQTWDHSCLDGTLAPLPCRGAFNESDSVNKQCFSSLYRVGQRGRAGKKKKILINLCSRSKQNNRLKYL